MSMAYLGLDNMHKSGILTWRNAIMKACWGGMHWVGGEGAAALGWPWVCKCLYGASKMLPRLEEIASSQEATNCQ